MAFCLEQAVTNKPQSQPRTTRTEVLSYLPSPPFSLNGVLADAVETSQPPAGFCIADVFGLR
jgi:hypothetical protein